jgi:hypothetical protein
LAMVVALVLLIGMIVAIELSLIVHEETFLPVLLDSQRAAQKKVPSVPHVVFRSACLLPVVLSSEQ